MKNAALPHYIRRIKSKFSQTMVSKFQTNTAYAQRDFRQTCLHISVDEIYTTTHIACIKDMRFTMYPDAKRTADCGGIA